LKQNEFPNKDRNYEKKEFKRRDKGADGEREE